MTEQLWPEDVAAERRMAAAHNDPAFAGSPRAEIDAMCLLTAGVFDVLLPMVKDGTQEEVQAVVERLLGRTMPVILLDDDKWSPVNLYLWQIFRSATRALYWDSRSPVAADLMLTAATNYAERLLTDDPSVTSPGWRYWDLLRDVALMRGHAADKAD